MSGYPPVPGYAGQIPNVPPPPTPAQEYAEAGIPPEQLQAFADLQNAQTPQAYMDAANRAGLTQQAWQAAAGQVAAGVAAGPVQAPSFEQQLAEYQQKNAALEAQLAQVSSGVQQQLRALQQQLSNVQSSVPQKVDPITESAAKVVQAFKDVIPHDAKTILHSALNAHLVALGLADLAKLL